MMRPSRNLIFFGMSCCFIMIPAFFYWGNIYAMIIPVVFFIFLSAFDLFISLPLLGQIKIRLEDKIRGLSLKSFRIPMEFDSQSKRELEILLVFKSTLWAKNIDEIKFRLPPSCKSLVTLIGQFASRGKYPFGSISLVMNSYIKLWELQRSFTIEETVSVYPAFHEQRKTLSSQFFNKNAFGFHQFKQVGKGKDFERLREYEPGDSFEDISWKATAKRGAPISKVYQIEKTQEIYLAIDCSRLCMKKYTNEKGEVSIVLEKYLEVAFLLGEFCAMNGDKFGLILFSDHIIKFIKAKSGKQHLKYCKEILFNIKPYHLSPDFGEVFSEIFERIPKRSFILFLSNLEDIAEAEIFSEKVKFICRKHLTLVQMMQTNDIKPIFSSEVSSTSEIANELSNHLRWSNILQVKKQLKLNGVDFYLVDKSIFTLNAINAYISVKQRQAI